MEQLTELLFSATGLLIQIRSQRGRTQWGSRAGRGAWRPREAEPRTLTLQAALQALSLGIRRIETGSPAAKNRCQILAVITCGGQHLVPSSRKKQGLSEEEHPRTFTLHHASSSDPSPLPLKNHGVHFIRLGPVLQAKHRASSQGRHSGTLDTCVTGKQQEGRMILVRM